jgi:IclR family pca regulon transcriptional regulator
MATPDPLENDEREDDRDYVNSLARGLNVIRAFNRHRPAMTLSEVARQTGINRAAARRFLITLVRDGYAETDGKYFRLRPKILELGFSALSSMTLSQIAEPVMEDLSDALDEMSLAAVLDGEWVVYVARATARRVISVDLDVGSRLPAFCMSTGRVLLAALPDAELDRWLAALSPVKFTEHTVTSKRKLRDLILRTREAGWSIVDQEYEIGFASISVPILDGHGETIAALNVCCPTPRVSIDDMRERFLPEMLEAALRITDSLARIDLKRGRENGAGVRGAGSRRRASGR